MLSLALEAVLAEKRAQYGDRGNVCIEQRDVGQAYGVFANAEESALKRIVSNLIDNSVEAFKSKGDVVVQARMLGSFAEISVEDNGFGIPADILSAVGERGTTYGKSTGTGLGLAYARACAEQWGGTLVIESTMGQGTKVTLRLPVTPTPSWFLGAIRVSLGSEIVVVDDDPSVHEIWKKRFQAFNVRLVHLMSLEQLRKHNLEASRVGRTYLIDHEFAGSRETGLELILDLKIQQSAFLVTSRAETRRLQDLCVVEGIKLLPKSMASLIPIECP